MIWERDGWQELLGSRFWQSHFPLADAILDISSNSDLARDTRTPPLIGDVFQFSSQLKVAMLLLATPFYLACLGYAPRQPPPQGCEDGGWGPSRAITTPPLRIFIA